MLSKREKDVLTHIVGYCDEIKGMIATFDDTLETLTSNNIYRHAVSMCVLQIGELTVHLSADFIKAHPLIPWKEIRKMRNIAAHSYERFSMGVLHDTITNDVPELRDYCQKLLDRSSAFTMTAKGC